MIRQLQFNFELPVFMHVHVHENNSCSQAARDSNVIHFSKQCRTLFDALMRGEVHNGDTARDCYQIRDMIRRYHDLDDAGVQIKQETIPNSHGMINIYMTIDQRIYNKSKFQHLL